MMAAILICCTFVCTACGSDDDAVDSSELKAMADRIWEFFTEDQLEETIKFGIENEQMALYVISTGEEIVLEEKVESSNSAAVYDMQGQRLNGQPAPKRTYRQAAGF